MRCANRPAIPHPALFFHAGQQMHEPLGDTYGLLLSSSWSYLWLPSEAECLGQLPPASCVQARSLSRVCVILWWPDAIGREGLRFIASRPKFKPQPSSLWKNMVSYLSLLPPRPHCSFAASIPVCLLWPYLGAPSSSLVWGSAPLPVSARSFIFQVPVNIPAPRP